jgi:hypothetical protein
MTWAQVYDGVAAYSHAASNVSTPNGFVFKARFRILSLPSGNGQIHIGIGTGTEQIGIGGQANGQFRIQVRNTGVNIPGSIVLNQWYDFEMSQPAGAGFRDITSFLDAVQVDTRGKPSPALGGHPLFIGANTALSSFLECDIETIEYTELTTGSDDGLWDATASSHAAGTPILTDTINSNNTTGVNMATGGTVANGGVWLDLGGSGISIAVNSTLPGLSSSLSLSKIDNSFSVDVNSTLPSLTSLLSLTNTDNIFDLSVSSELPSLTSMLNLSVVNPSNNTAINSFLPSLVSSLNLAKTEPTAGVSINSELPSLISSLSLAVTNPELDFSVVSTLPSLSSSLSLYNGVLGISVGDRNNINIVVKSTNINVITKSRNIEEY